MIDILLQGECRKKNDDGRGHFSPQFKFIMLNSALTRKPWLGPAS